jgi:hypothetical protein
MSTRGALATMPVPLSALRNWALCARMTDGTANSEEAQKPLRTRTEPLCLPQHRAGLRQRPTSFGELHTGSVPMHPGAAMPRNHGAEGKFHEAT